MGTSKNPDELATSGAIPLLRSEGPKKVLLPEFKEPGLQGSKWTHEEGGCLGSGGIRQNGGNAATSRMAARDRNKREK